MNEVQADQQRLHKYKPFLHYSTTVVCGEYVSVNIVQQTATKKGSIKPTFKTDGH